MLPFAFCPIMSFFFFFFSSFTSSSLEELPLWWAGTKALAPRQTLYPALTHTYLQHKAKWGQGPMGGGQWKKEGSKHKECFPRGEGGTWEDNRKFLFRTYWCWDISESSKWKWTSGFWDDRSVGGGFPRSGLERGTGYHLHKVGGV